MRLEINTHNNICICWKNSRCGVDPKVEIHKHLNISKKFKNVKILWASVRQSFNIIEAERIKCHIITIPPNILSKLKTFIKNLNRI